MHSPPNQPPTPPSHESQPQMFYKWDDDFHISQMIISDNILKFSPPFMNLSQLYFYNYLLKSIFKSSPPFQTTSLRQLYFYNYLLENILKFSPPFCTTSLRQLYLYNYLLNNLNSSPPFMTMSLRQLYLPFMTTSLRKLISFYLFLR